VDVCFRARAHGLLAEGREPVGDVLVSNHGAEIGQDELVLHAELRTRCRSQARIGGKHAHAARNDRHARRISALMHQPLPERLRNRERLLRNVQRVMNVRHPRPIRS
jgi:hypothetical protein